MSWPEGLSSHPAPPAGAPGLIDAHCHLFNVKDLSPVRFIAYAILHLYPQVAEPLASQSLTGPDKPTLLDRVIGVVLVLVGTRRAPSARTELAYLQRHVAALALATDEDVTPVPLDIDRNAVVDEATAFLGGRSLTGDEVAETLVRGMIVDAGGGPAGLEGRQLFDLPEEERRRIAVQALALAEQSDARTMTLVGRPFYFAGLVDFVVQLKRYRHKLVDHLANLHAREGRPASLMAPAMVDFGRWLVEDPQPRSDLATQVAVWAEIARRPEGPAVHGYVAFCPLRQVLHQRSRDASESPLQIVERALETEGFLGVKLYPPMGFRAAGNKTRAQNGPGFSREVLRLVFGSVPESEVRARTLELGTALDEALDALYGVCERLRAPIMAHGGNSVGAGAETGELADPYYWRPVFDRPAAPAVMLAHFGGFGYQTADPDWPSPTPPPGRVPFDHTWEAWLARYIKAHPAAPVFADISMFTEVLPSAGQHVRDSFTRLRDEFPTIEDHLVFGTDWVMLAQAKGVSRYDRSVAAFLRSIFGEAGTEKIMRTNFLRYADLGAAGAGLDRVAKVYRGDAGLTARLRAACAT